MSAPGGRDDRARALAREAARWRLAGLLLRRPRPGWREEVEALARECGDEVLGSAADAAAGATEGEYLALVGPGGPVSPREVSYRPLEDPGRLLAEIARYHEAFAYRGSGEDPRDHVAVAADFVAFLALKEAYAVESENAGGAETTRAARRSFVERHVRATARGMSRRLAAIVVPDAYLAVALRGFGGLAGVDVDGAGGEPAPDELPFLPPGLDGDELECGAADGASCAQACPWEGPARDSES